VVCLATSGWAEYVFIDILQRPKAKYPTVPISSQRARWKLAGCQESKLVDLFRAAFFWSMCTILGHQAAYLRQL